MVEYSILDYALVDEGKNSEDAVKKTVELAKLADQLGFKRFWVTEHHNVPAFACPSPELLMMQMLSQTSSIRIGSGGVMLPHYSPFKVAENMRMLEAFYPNRVDIGIGNNAGTPQVQAAMQDRENAADNYLTSIHQLYEYLTNQQDEVIVQPRNERTPEMWLLSIGERSAKTAAELGLGYTFGTFLLPDQAHIDQAQQSNRLYREQFKSSPIFSQSKVMATTFIIVGENETHAEQLAHALGVWLLGKQSFAEFKQFPSIETAADYILTDEEKERIKAQRASIIVGTEETIRPQIERLIEANQADEVLFAPLISDIETRRRTVKAIAKAMMS